MVTTAKVDLSDGLDLSDVMGMFMGAQAAKPQQTQSSQGDGILSGLADLIGDTDDEASFNGTSLLSALLGR